MIVERNHEIDPSSMRKMTLIDSYPMQLCSHSVPSDFVSWKRYKQKIFFEKARGWPMVAFYWLIMRPKGITTLPL
jgi:hypothetical protein